MGNFSDRIATFSPEYDWRCQESSGTLANSGSASTSSLSAVGTGGTYSVTGPTAYEGDLAVNTTDTLAWDRANAVATTHTSGTIILAARSNTTTQGSAGHESILQIGNAGGAFRAGVAITTGKNLLFEVADGTFPAQYFKIGTADVYDAGWHLLVVRQRADSTGIELFVDGAVDTPSTTGGPTGDLTVDGWIKYAVDAGSDRTSLGESAAAVANPFDGDIARAVIMTHTISDADITYLWDNFITEVTDLGTFAKTKRRRGRRVFIDSGIIVG